MNVHLFGRLIQLRLTVYPKKQRKCDRCRMWSNRAYRHRDADRLCVRCSDQA